VEWWTLVVLDRPLLNVCDASLVRVAPSSVLLTCGVLSCLGCVSLNACIYIYICVCVCVCVCMCVAGW
jgi:hypothetical protein